MEMIMLLIAAARTEPVWSPSMFGVVMIACRKEV
jgi:hypothetical protein